MKVDPVAAINSFRAPRFSRDSASRYGKRMNFHNRFASTQGHNKEPCGRGWGDDLCSSVLSSPKTPPSSAAVVRTKLGEEKTLAGFDLTGHSESHIQPELVNPIYAAENSTTLTNPKLTNWGASPPRYTEELKDLI